MYVNLHFEMMHKNIKRKDLAELLGVRNATISDKINEKSRFRIDEVFKIKERYFPELTIEYLFSSFEVKHKK